MTAYFKYYKWAALIPSAVAIIGYILYATLGPDKNYKSEWLTAESVQLFSIGIFIILCLLVCVLSLTIFLLKCRCIRKNVLLSLSCCFLPPIAFLLCFAYSLGKDPESLPFSLFLTIPFLVGFSLAYVKFRRAAS